MASNILQHVHTQLKPLMDPILTQDTLESSMFREVVSRSIADVSGHISTNKRDVINNYRAKDPFSPRVTLKQVMDGIKAYIPGHEVLDFILGNIKNYQKGIVQTPHPTEMMGKEAIQAEEKLLNALENAGAGLFEGNDLDRLTTQQRQVIGEALSALKRAIQPVEKGLGIKDEMDRSVIFSERIFDAIPTIADRILTAYNAESTTQISSEMTDKQLQGLFHLVAPQTWSPGDRDSKYEMTTDMLEYGYHLNCRRMASHYAKQLVALAEISCDLDNIAHHGPHEDALFNTLRRLLATSFAHRDTANEKHFSDFNHYLADFVKTNAQSDSNILSRLATAADQPAYEQSEELLADLFAMRETGKFHQPLPGKKDSKLTVMDALIVQAGNFGLTALTSQMRQNREVHEGVFHHLTTLLQELLPDATPHSLIAAMKTDKAPQIQQVIKQELERIRQADHHAVFSADYEADFNFYQTMTGLQFAAEHSDFIPHYLIAECGSNAHVSGTDDMLMTLALLQAVSPSAEQRKKLHLSPVEIVPLVEHPHQVMEDKQGRIPYVEMMKEVLSDPVFLAHQREITQARYQHLLEHTTQVDGQIKKQPLTGRDILQSYEPGLKNLESQPATPVEHAMLLMGAGSDVTKFGGEAAAGLMQHAMHRLRIELAQLAHPVQTIDFIGCGGGVHRTQPVSNRYETVQGRSMRQTPDAIATKVCAMLARDMHHRLIHSPDHQPEPMTPQTTPMSRYFKIQDRGTLVQLNLGNMSNLPRNNDIWERISKPLMQEAVGNYQSFFNSPPFTALMQYSASPYAKLTSFAARPQNRVGTGAGEDRKFPPRISLDGLRAISYGASLNGSGSNASFYCGMRTLAQSMLSDDKAYQDIKQAYWYDPQFEDMINRATYGIVMSDMDSAWRYLGQAATPDSETINEWASRSDEGASQLDLARKALAQITQEHRIVSQALLKLHKDIAVASGRHHYSSGHSNEIIQEQLLHYLPDILAQQLKDSRDTIALPRLALSLMFQKFLSNNGEMDADVVDERINNLLPLPIANVITRITDKEPQRLHHEKLTDYYSNILYPAMGTLMECFEHCPRAYTSPHWALLEQNRSQQAKAA